MDRTNSIITLVGAMINGSSMSLLLFALDHDRLAWVWIVGLTAACVQGMIATASLWAWRIQNTRARSIVDASKPAGHNRQA
jgi:protein-S-isoprenylcysteine O-methyltransferase Ste14